MTKTGLAAITMGALLLAAGSAMAKGKNNDFPTQARVEYVMACMSDTGENYMSLRRCSCALDTIASHMTYDQFVDAQTIRSMQQSRNAHADIYRNLDVAKKPLDRFYLAEAYAQLRCF